MSRNLKVFYTDFKIQRRFKHFLVFWNRAIHKRYMQQNNASLTQKKGPIAKFYIVAMHFFWWTNLPFIDWLNHAGGFNIVLRSTSLDIKFLFQNFQFKTRKTSEVLEQIQFIVDYCSSLFLIEGDGKCGRLLAIMGTVLLLLLLFYFLLLIMFLWILTVLKVQFLGPKPTPVTVLFRRFFSTFDSNFNDTGDFPAIEIKIELLLSINS